MPKPSSFRGRMVLNRKEKLKEDDFVNQLRCPAHHQPTKTHRSHRNEEEERRRSGGELTQGKKDEA